MPDRRSDNADTLHIETIIGQAPKAMFRIGIIAIGTLVTVIMLSLVLIRYPDTLEGQVRLISANPPITIYSQTEGRVEELLKMNGDIVEESEVLLIMKHEGLYTKIKPVIDSVEYMVSRLGTADERFSILGIDGMGQLRAALISYNTALQDFNFEKSNFSKSRKNQVANRIELAKEELEVLRQVRMLANDESEIRAKDYKRYRQLLEQEAASEIELESKELAKLSKEGELLNLQTRINDKQSSIRENQYEIEEMNRAHSERLHQKYTMLLSAFMSLLSEIETWKFRHLVRSPIHGRLNYTGTLWAANQYMDARQALGSVVPINVDTILVKSVFPLDRKGEVQAGMPIKIRLDEYPYQDHGVLSAQVQFVSEMPIIENGRPSGYEIQSLLSAPLITSSGKDIAYSGELRGSATVILEKKSLLRHLIDEIVPSFNSK